jgi:Golgi nucleoside diphosphatase
LGDQQATLNETAIFLLATAGMRLLTTTQQDAILTEVRSFIHNDTQFLFEDDWTQVLSGTQEAIFDWVTVQQVLFLPFSFPFVIHLVLTLLMTMATSCCVMVEWMVDSNRS